MKAIKNAKRMGLALLCGFLLALGCFALGLLWGGRAGEPKISSDLLVTSLRQAQELTTVKYMYTNMGKFQQSTDFYGWKVPFTTKSFIVSYDGEITAGVDLGRATVERKGKTLVVGLPQAEIFAHVIAEDSIQVFDESSNLFNPIRITDYTNFSLDQKTALEERAKENGLLEEARTRAEQSITDLLAGLMQADSLEIKFENIV